MLDSALDTVAYLSMEVCLEQGIPTYSGGLGVLAGDTLRSAADLGLHMVAVTLVHRKGYFHQHLDAVGQQTEEPVQWQPERVLEPLEARVTVPIDGRLVTLAAWRYEVQGCDGHHVPVILLDADLPENSDWDRALTDSLYGGDAHYRLCQEVILGMGGAAMLHALGYNGDLTYHINEGHAALLLVTLLERELARRGATEATDADLEAVRRQCVFTTHTPVPAGHDRFTAEQLESVLSPASVGLLRQARALGEDGGLNMTYLALRLTRYVNAVALRHREISQGMFPEYRISSITNGVHAATWASPPFRELFDQRIPDWRRDNLYLRNAVAIPLEEIRAAHAAAKAALFDEVERKTAVRLDPAHFTIGFARRATPYKRSDLIFTDLDRLRAIAAGAGRLQIIFGGKAHPRDDGGKALIRHIFEAAKTLDGLVRVVYLENYEMNLARLMTSGVDVWLNNPMKPLEASGTSGMKAALNGVPSFSVLDGWWIEGHIEGVTGWAIDGVGAERTDGALEAADLYARLENAILPLFYGSPMEFARVMRQAIAYNGSFFNTQRMVMQYMRDAYYPPRTEPAGRILAGAGAIRAA